MSMGITAAFAQNVAYTGTDGDGASITISNAANGETYKVVKLFDATVTGTTDGSIAYQGTVPSALANFFEADSAGNITLKRIADASGKTPGQEGYVETFYEMTAADFATMKTWADGQTATASGEGDGTALVFTGLPYGYYVITSTQGATVTVDSTNPNVTVVDKNTTEPQIQKKVKDASGNWVEVTDANIGEDQDFKLDIVTTNWHAPKKAADATEEPAQKQIKSYTIGEDFDTNKFTLSSITSVTVITLNDNGTVKETHATITPTPTSFPITVSWVDNAGKSIYPNGAVIRVEYKAKLNDDALVDVGNENADLQGNVNTGDLNWTYKDDTPHFGEGEDHLKDTASVDTYAIALKKFDKNGNALAGAKFQFPFYVKADADGNAVANDNGDYVYAGTAAGDKLTNIIVTPADGMITVVGVKAGTYSITETEAPNGYNKLTSPVSVTAVKISSTETVTTSSKSWKIDENGNVTDLVETDPETVTKTTYENDKVAATAIGIINLTGTELPSTGGIGTTIFYVVGSIMVVAAGVLLVTKKRMSREG